MQVTVSDVMNAERSDAVEQQQHDEADQEAGRRGAQRRLRPTDRRVASRAMSPPRASTARERSAITTMMTMNGSASPGPAAAARSTPSAAS